MIICDISLVQARALIDIVSSKIAPDAVSAAQLYANEAESLHPRYHDAPPPPHPGHTGQHGVQRKPAVLATGCAALDRALGGGLHAGSRAARARKTFNCVSSVIM